MTRDVGEFAPPRSMAHEVWDVLVEDCGAYPGKSERRTFVLQWPECREYRFMGLLGGGGKVWWNGGRIYVNCYPEHLTPEREDIIDAANKRLAAVLSASSTTEAEAQP